MPGEGPGPTVAEETEVAVVGASPAGLTAAIQAARSGAQVDLLEGRPEIGVPEAPAKVAFDALLPPGAGPRDAHVRSRFEHVVLSGPGGTSLEVQAPGQILHRTRFDQHLVQRAIEAGVRVRTGLGEVAAPRPDRLEADSLVLDAEVTIFADGHPSLAGRFMAPIQAPEAIRWGVIHVVEAPSAGPDPPLHLQVGSHAPGGRTQLVPLGDGRCEHWTFARTGPERARRLADQAVADPWPGIGRLQIDETVPVRTGPDPAHALPGALAGRRCLVTGGAGGLGGLEVGLSAGRAAGRAAARSVDGGGQAALDRYHEAMHAQFGDGYRGLAQLMDVVEGLPDGALDEVLGPWEGQVVDLDTVAGLAKGRPAARGLSLGRMLAAHPGAALRSFLGLARRPADLWSAVSRR